MIHWVTTGADDLASSGWAWSRERALPGLDHSADVRPAHRASGGAVGVFGELFKYSGFVNGAIGAEGFDERDQGTERDLMADAPIDWRRWYHCHHRHRLGFWM
jgi:hypothetical protein